VLRAVVVKRGVSLSTKWPHGVRMSVRRQAGGGGAQDAQP